MVDQTGVSYRNFVLFRVISWIDLAVKLKAIHEVTRTNTKTDLTLMLIRCSVEATPDNHPGISAATRKVRFPNSCPGNECSYSLVAVQLSRVSMAWTLSPKSI